MAIHDNDYAAWKFNTAPGPLVDSVGVNTLICDPLPPTSVAGKFAEGFTPQGSSTQPYILAGVISPVLNAAGSWTIGCWAKPDLVQTQYNGIFNQWGASATQNLIISTDEGTLYCYLQTESGPLLQDVTIPLTGLILGDWNWFGIVWDLPGLAATVYINKIPVKVFDLTGAGNSKLDPGSSELVFGQLDIGGTHTFDGSIDDAFIALEAYGQTIIDQIVDSGVDYLATGGAGTAPIITTASPITTALEGVPGDILIAASGTDPKTWSEVTGSWPAWVTSAVQEGNGYRVSWTNPTAGAGQGNVELSVTNGTPPDDSQVFAFDVAAAAPTGRKVALGDVDGGTGAPTIRNQDWVPGDYLETPDGDRVVTEADMGAYQTIEIDPAIPADVTGKKYADPVDAMDWWQGFGPVGVTIIRVPGGIYGTGAVYTFAGDQSGKYLVIQGSGRNLTSGTATRLAYIFTVPGGVPLSVRVLIRDAEVTELQVAEKFSSLDLENVKLFNQSSVGFASLRDVECPGIAALDVGITGETGDVFLRRVQTFQLNLGLKVGTTVYAEGLVGVDAGTKCNISAPLGPGSDGVVVLSTGCRVDTPNGVACITQRGGQDMETGDILAHSIDWTGTGTTTSGVAAFYLTDDGTGGGVALFSAPQNVQATAECPGVIPGDIIHTAVKTGFGSLVEVVATNADGTAWAPDGTIVHLRVRGIPA